VLYLGTAQEKMRTIRTEKRRNPETGATFPWLVESTVVAKVYYWYIVDEDFGPLFIKYGSYFPYPMKICLNGNEYLKRQLAKEGIAFEAEDSAPKPPSTTPAMSPSDAAYLTWQVILHAVKDPNSRWGPARPSAPPGPFPRLRAPGGAGCHRDCPW
jgi:hypothetical protein